MGPGAGVHGGTIVAAGHAGRDHARTRRRSPGPYLSGEKQLAIPPKRSASPTAASIRVVGARAHNLQNVTVEIPVGLFTRDHRRVAARASRASSSTRSCRAARAELYRATAPVGECDGIEGLVAHRQGDLDRPGADRPHAALEPGDVHRASSRCCASSTPACPRRARAATRPGRFSFNVKGGRCEACQGDGVLRIEMHFLPDIFVTCETCGGQRYNRETLEVLYRGMSIADALDLTVEQAHRAVRGHPARARAARSRSRRVGPRLHHARPARDDALGRRGAAREARARARAQGDGPHALRARRADDGPALLGHRGADRARSSSLRDAGNTVVVIEHNLDVIACSDWVIDLGPEGGERGGDARRRRARPRRSREDAGVAHRPLPARRCSTREQPQQRAPSASRRSAAAARADGWRSAASARAQP